jgi:hypothetical protein
MRNHKEEIKQIAELYVSDFSDIEKLKKFIG